MRKRILSLLPLMLLLAAMLCTPVFALTESEVEAQVAATSKEAVTGNVLIWFLCAVAFLKVSQKIDSFMASMGVNVGRTGGSLLAEAMIAARGVSMLVKAGGGAVGSLGRAAAGSSGGTAAGSPGATGGFFKGGLIGMAGRHITNSAVKTATTQTSAVHTAQKQARQATAAAQTASNANINSGAHAGGSPIQTGNSVPTETLAQDGGIVAGGVSAPAAPMENTPSVGLMPDGIPPQEGEIVTGGISAPAAPIENVPSVGAVSDGIPPQEGVILTGSEAPPTIPADTSPQMESAPPEGVPADAAPPSGGVIITGGDTAIHASQTANTVQNSPAGLAPRENAAGTGGQGAGIHTERTSHTVHTAVSGKQAQGSRSPLFSAGRPTLGGMVFSRSLASGGKFANDVIGTVAKGDIRSAGSITGDLAAQSLSSYMGYTALGAGAQNIPRYSDVEIGGGRITGTETPAGGQEGLAFGMYHAAQYTAPEGPHEKVYSADGTLWYKQYAQDSVERRSYKAPDGAVAYEERIVKKLPTPPKRKDRI